MAQTKTFRYKVRDDSGKVIESTIEAADRGQVAQSLADRGYAPISVEEVSAARKGLSLQIGRKKVGLEDLTVFSRQFATLNNAGVALVRALSILEEQAENPALQEVISSLQAQVREGKALSQAMEEHSNVFPRLYIAMVSAGEISGTLDTVLERIATTYERELELRGKIKSALTYPVIVLVMAIVLTAAMLIFIVPTFEAMFDTLGGELPMLTQVLVAASDLLSSWWGLLFVAVPIALWQIYSRIKDREGVRDAIDKFKLQLPVFGELFRLVAISRMSRNMGTLARAGVPIVKSLEITRQTVNNELIGKALDDVSSGVREGQQMSPIMASHSIIPPMVAQMVAVGEETGQLDDMMFRIADFYDERVAATTEQLTASLEPVMIGVLGGIVGTMVIALYLPVFQVFELIE